MLDCEECKKVKFLVEGKLYKLWSYLMKYEGIKIYKLMQLDKKCVL